MGVLVRGQGEPRVRDGVRMVGWVISPTIGSHVEWWVQAPTLRLLAVSELDCLFEHLEKVLMHQEFEPVGSRGEHQIRGFRPRNGAPNISFCTLVNQQMDDQIWRMCFFAQCPLHWVGG